MSPRIRFLTPAFAAAMFLATTGCVITSGGGSRGDVTFLWSFNGQTCATIPDVTNVTIQIAGQTLDNGGAYNCSNSGTAGITLLSFAPGTYSYDIQGRNNAGTIIYQSSGKFTVNGNVTVNVNMQANQSAPGGAYITWTFPPSSVSNGNPATCAQASGQLTNVYVSIDGAAGDFIPCTQGQGAPGVLYQNLTAGTHTIDLAASDQYSTYYYRKMSTFTVIAGTNSSQQFTLDWYVGSLPVAWTFASTTTQLSCAAAGVNTLYINLSYVDGSGQTKFWYSSPVAVPCSAVQGYVFDFVYGGTYTIRFFRDPNGTSQYVTTPANPQLGATAGVFPTSITGNPITITVP